MLFGVAALVTGVSVPAAGAAAAGGSAAVTVPARQPSQEKASLLMLGAGGDRIAAAGIGGTVLTARIWSPLAGHGLAQRATPGTPTDLTGTTLRWAEASGGNWVLHVSDVLTGNDESYTTAERPLAWTPHGWIGFGDGAVVRHRYGQDEQVLLRGIADEGWGVPEVKADDEAALIWYSSGTPVANVRRLFLVTGAAGTTPEVEMLAENPDIIDGESVADAELTPNSIVWVTSVEPVRLGGYVYRRPRTGGEATRTELPGAAFALSATDHQVAVHGFARYRHEQLPVYLTRLWARADAEPGASWRRIGLPVTHPGLDGMDTELFGGIVPFGNGFAFALGGEVGSTAGIHAFEFGDAEPIAVLPPSTSPVTDVGLNAGRVFYGKAVSPATPVSPIWDHSVTSRLGGRPWLELGPEERSLFGFADALHAVDGRQPAASVSGDRAVIRTPGDDGRARFSLADQGSPTGVPAAAGPADLPVKVSGPYVLAGNKVFRADHEDGDPPLLDLDPENVRSVDLYGPRVVWSTTDGRVRTQDLAEGGAAVTLVTGDATGPVAAWGTTLAWARSGGLTVRTPAPPSTRHIELGSEEVRDLRLTEGTLSWTDGDHEPAPLRLLDLRSPGSTPVTTSLLSPSAVDDHLAAGIDDHGQVRVETLPHGMYDRYRPRLIGALAAPEFNPIEDAWAPQFDTTKPLGRVRLKIFGDGGLVRTLTGSAPHGSIRDLSWNGETDDGHPAPAGTYTWTLTAMAEDGEGALTGVDGRSRVTGTLVLRR